MIVLAHALVEDVAAPVGLGRRGHIGEAGKEHDIGLAVARIDALQDMIVEQPALRLGIFLVGHPGLGQKIHILLHLAVFDRDPSGGPHRSWLH